MPRKIDLQNDADDLQISNEDLQYQVDRYNSERMIHFPDHLKGDSRSVWISKEKLVEFLSRNSNANGIRMYFGVVDDPFFQPGVHNLLLIPTVTTDGAQQDQVGDEDWVAVCQNFESLEITQNPKSVICPPPMSRCRGIIFKPVPDNEE